VAAIVVLGALVAAIFLALPRDDTQDEVSGGSATTETTLAAEDPRTLIASSLATTTSLRGILVAAEADSQGALREMRWNVASTAAGDFRLIGNNSTSEGSLRTDAVAYSAQDGVEKTYSREGGGEPVAVERSGLAAGPPDAGPSDWILQSDFAVLVAIVMAADDPEIAETTYEGRPVWTLLAAADPEQLPGGIGSHVEVTADQATGFPVSARVLLDGEVVREYRLEELELDQPLTRGQFNMTFPEDVEASATDYGFDRVADPSSVVGYEPLEPGWLPDGFVLALTAVAAEAAATGADSSNPTSLSVTSSVYRRGFDEIVVSTRSLGDDPSAWTNPFAGLEGFGDDSETVDLEAGAFAGSEARTSRDDDAVRYLWAVNDTLVVTATGDASVSDLIAVVESLGAEQQ
jgi:hypothetical protein